MVLRLFISIVKWNRNKFMKTKNWKSVQKVKEKFDNNYKRNDIKKYTIFVPTTNVFFSLTFKLLLIYERHFIEQRPG